MTQAKRGRPRKDAGTVESLGFKTLGTEINGPAVTYSLAYGDITMTMTAYDGEDIFEIAEGWLKAASE